MAFSWVPPACYDGELDQQFLSKKDWAWFLDQQGNVSASSHIIAQGEANIAWVTWEYQRTHCTYTWRKLHRAITAARPLDGYIRDYHHTAHCEMILLRDILDDQDFGEPIYTKYPNCGGPNRGRLGWFRVIKGSRYHRDE